MAGEPTDRFHLDGQEPLPDWLLWCVSTLSEEKPLIHDCRLFMEPLSVNRNPVSKRHTHTNKQCMRASLCMCTKYSSDSQSGRKCFLVGVAKVQMGVECLRFKKWALYKRTGITGCWFFKVPFPQLSCLIYSKIYSAAVVEMLIKCYFSTWHC